MFTVENDQDRLIALEGLVSSARDMGHNVDSPLVKSLTWASEFIARIVNHRDDRIAAPFGYRPIEELPDVAGQHVVFYNSCNGPHLDHLIQDSDAHFAREEGVWTHFIILPESADEIETDRVRDLLEANNRYLVRARAAEQKLAEIDVDAKINITPFPTCDVCGRLTSGNKRHFICVPR